MQIDTSLKAMWHVGYSNDYLQKLDSMSSKGPKHQSVVQDQACKAMIALYIRSVYLP